MKYIICNKFGEPKDDMPNMSSDYNKLTAVQDFGLQDREGNAISGYLLTVDGKIYYAIADITPVEDPPTPFIDSKAKPYSD